MRPLRVEVEGIGSFRGRAELDLTGVDLFALSGPTGAGKTTLMVDAMVLALYGTVPRYDDRRLVAPIVHQGANEGRVRLTFSIGTRTFTATRVIRRTKTGATTKEARLEETTGGGSRVLAGNADEVTQASESLIGLSFDQFCRSVVLPQGAFDRFLFAKPAERADLLVQLLDLGQHDRVGRRARALATEAAARVDAARRQLDGDLAGVDAAEEVTLTAREAALDRLAARCREAQVELDELRERGGELRAASDAAAAQRDALASLHRPGDVAEVASRTRDAVAARERAAVDRDHAADALDAAEAARTALPGAAELDAVVRAIAERDGAYRDVPSLTAAAEAAATAVRAADEAVATADDAVARARAELDDARRRELVHAVTAGVHTGDDCPVCGTPLVEEPPVGDGTRTATAEAALRSAEADATAASAGSRTAAGSAAAAAERLGAAQRRAETADAAVARALAATGADDERAAAEIRRRAEAADAAVARARDTDRAARTTLTAADRDLERTRVAETTAWEALDRARGAVAASSPPAAPRDDLAAAWDGLLAWAEVARPAAAARADDAAAAVQAQIDRYRDADRELRGACAAEGVEVAPGHAPGEAVASELATVRARRARLAERLAQVEQVRAELAAAQEEAQVAGHLGKLLQAQGFERWLLARALRRLVGGASALLRDLTSGAYSLALDDTNAFLVVDHRSADEPRTVKSLSGGERFLASLALALALADHVADLAADGAARLESLFLDEGFGTLDPDTLDVVASALEELGSRGRVVGIVTHVRDLAERLPVRFEVGRGPDGSHVTRVDLVAAHDTDPDTDRGTGSDPDTGAGGTAPADATPSPPAAATVGP